MASYQPDGTGDYVEIYPGSAARYYNANSFINAYYVDYCLLSLLQDYSLLPMPSALGFRIQLDGPYDFEMGINIAVLLAGAGQPWAVVYANLFGGYLALQSHFNKSVLYRLLVEEGLPGFGFVWDVLGYDAYFD